MYLYLPRELSSYLIYLLTFLVFLIVSVPSLSHHTTPHHCLLVLFFEWEIIRSGQCFTQFNIFPTSTRSPHLSTTTIRTTSAAIYLRRVVAKTFSLSSLDDDEDDHQNDSFIQKMHEPREFKVFDVYLQVYLVFLMI